MNSKLHAVGDGAGRPIRLHLTAGQRSDFKGADALLPDLPPAKVLIADRGYDSAKVRKIVEDQKIEACIPSKKNRKKPIPHCEVTYKRSDLQETPQGREPLRQTQGLAPHRHAL